MEFKLADFCLLFDILSFVALAGTWRSSTPAFDTNLENQFVNEVIFSSCQTRCGTLDELDMVEANRCECHPKDDEGANDGVWFSLEVINIPYYSSMSHPNNTDFKKVKKIVEEAVCSAPDG